MAKKKAQRLKATKETEERGISSVFPSFEDKKAFLSQAQVWPDNSARVDICETHLSCVFLTGRHAWKLKKPIIREPFIDFSTPAKRRYYCTEELLLNRRLAPDVYLDVVPFFYRPAKGLFFCKHRPKDSITADWLVKMKRLPSGITLRDRIENNDVRNDEIDALGMRLVRFFEEAEKIEITPDEYIRNFLTDIEYSYELISKGEADLPQALIKNIYERQIRFLKDERALLAKRTNDHKIIEGHGDLRPEHIYFREPEMISIIDCLEFDRSLRMLDMTDELAFLMMACSAMGNSRVGERVFDIYRHVTGDRIHPALINFYAGVRALTRARLALIHIKEMPHTDTVNWHKKCLQYLKWADHYCEQQSEVI